MYVCSCSNVSLYVCSQYPLDGSHYSKNIVSLFSFKVLSFIFVATAFVIIFSTTENPVPLYPHGLIGILLVALLLMQLLSGIL